MFSRKRIGERQGDTGDSALTLDRISVGQSACVKTILGGDAIAVRLLEMGVTPGSMTRVLGTAFSGDPIEIEIRNYRLTLRRSEASRVVLETDRTLFTAPNDV
jgi:ferrous iron transport protein A